MKGATIFSGGEGVGVGMRLAGIEHLWGIEYNDEIAQVARDNGFNSITADVRDVNVKKLEWPDILHASPVCKNASVAKTGHEEADEDIETAFATCRFIDELKPDIFTLENVWGYRNFRAFQIILDDLTRNGYKYEYWHLNAANFGVPQTRKRLILVARSSGVPRKPQQTHAKKAVPLFDTLRPWVGWYAAIEDLIPMLPESQFAPWQLERLPEDIRQSELVNNAFPGSNGKKHNAVAEPAFTVDTLTLAHMRAFIVGGANTSDGQAAPGVGVSEMDEPTRCVASNASSWKALIVNGGCSRNYEGGNITARTADDPMFVITNDIANRPTSHMPKAFIVDDQNSGTPNEDGERGLTIRDNYEPTFTVSATQTKQSLRAWLATGRVVAMTPRCLARFQSFPDSYILPESNSLACRVIGNAVPPLLYQRVIEAQLN